MKFLKSLLMGTGGVVLAGLLLALLAPKAVHAVVATAVQVVNTSANPAVTADTSRLASQLLQVECFVAQVSPPAELTSCNFIAPTGLRNGPSSFVTIPPTQNFVITSVDLQGTRQGAVGTTCPADATTALLINSPGVGQTQRASWVVAGNSGIQHFAYPSGILITGGSEFVGLAANSSNLPICVITVDLFGYLTTL